MSSLSSRRPDFRLSFGYPFVTLTEDGRPEPVDRIDLSDQALASRLRALGGTIRRARGRLTVVLPETEVWRGALELGARTPLARRAEARAAIAARMSVLPGSLATVLGSRGPSGRTPTVAVRHSTLAETRCFLRQAGLRTNAIIGAGAFPGFAAPPRLGPPIWRDVTRANAARLRGAPAAKALALGATCLALIFALALEPAETTLAAPEPASVTQAPPLATAVASASPTVPARLALLSAPRPHPAPSPRPVAPARMAYAGPVAISQATRNMPELAGVRLGDRPSSTRTAERIVPAATLPATTLPATTLTDAAAPPRRPAARAAVAAEPAKVAAQSTAAPAATESRPLRRPGTPAATPVATTPIAATPAPRTAEAATPPADAAARPLARPGAAAPTTLSAAITDAVAEAASAPKAPVRVASLTSTTSDAITLAAPASTIPPPEPRPVRAAATPVTIAAPKPVAKPAVIRAAAPQPVRAQPSPVVTRQASLAPQKAVAKPAPQQVQRQVTAQPVRTASARPAVEKSGLSRGSVSLLGVFGSQGARHALLRLPNGTVKRVRQGDTIQGTQVALVSANSVRLSGGGRDTLLKME